MALKSLYKTPEGRVDAYWRVSDLRYNYDKPHGVEVDKAVVFSLEVLNWETREVYQDVEWMYEEGVGSYSMPAVPDGTTDTLVEKAYTHLKSLALFSGAEDC